MDSTQITKSPPQNKGALTLSVAFGLTTSIVLLGTPMKAFPALLSKPLGVAVGLTSIALISRHGLKSSDISSAVELVQDSWGEWLEGNEGKQINKIVLSNLPEGRVKTIAQKMLSPMVEDRTWVHGLLRSTTLLAGRRNTGKTTLMHYLLSRVLEQGYEALVFDPNYGKRGNTWFSLPVANLDRSKRTDEGKVIYPNTLDLLDLMHEFTEELDRRRQQVFDDPTLAHKLPRRYLFVCEYNVTASNLAHQASSEDLKRMANEFRRLVYEAHGYNLFMIAEVQTLAKGETEINTAQLGQCNVALLGDAATDRLEVGKLTTDVQPVIDAIKGIQGEGHRACYLKIDGEAESRIGIVPYIDISTIEIEISSDPLKDWLDQIPWSELPTSSPTAAWKACMGSKRQAGEQWNAFKSEFENRNRQEMLS